MLSVKTIAASTFRAKCLAILDEVDAEGIVITKRGKPVAKLTRYTEPINHGHLIGILKHKRVIVDPNDDLLSTGEWISDEWGDLNVPGYRFNRKKSL